MSRNAVEQKSSADTGAERTVRIDNDAVAEFAMFVLAAAVLAALMSVFVFTLVREYDHALIALGAAVPLSGLFWLGSRLDWL